MAVSSSTDICNLALDLLSSGTVQDIENPTNPTEELLNRWYDQCRRKVLREHPWNFAAKRIQLAASSTAPAFGYSTQFPVPADFIRVLTINDSTYTSDVPSSSTQYKVENNHILISDLFSDSTVLNLVYVSDYTNVSGMDPMFIDILSYEIALSVAYKVSESNTNIQRIAELHKQRSAMAKAIDGQESPPKVIERSRSRHVRRNNHSSVDSTRIRF